ncbi:MAG: LysM peptidoglycan-binding protein [Cyanobacteria bacterium RYN_339]|nr:LysM peptidoglycan-binding protein [Cyanobacteria bacterium RYN_339]
MITTSTAAAPRTFLNISLPAVEAQLPAALKPYGKPDQVNATALPGAVLPTSNADVNAALDGLDAAPTTDYEVKPNDSVCKIAREQLGDERRWKEVAELNGLKGPKYTIHPGQHLKLPETEVQKAFQGINLKGTLEASKAAMDQLKQQQEVDTAVALVNQTVKDMFVTPEVRQYLDQAEDRSRMGEYRDDIQNALYRATTVADFKAIAKAAHGGILVHADADAIAGIATCTPETRELLAQVLADSMADEPGDLDANLKKAAASCQNDHDRAMVQQVAELARNFGLTTYVPG